MKTIVLSYLTFQVMEELSDQKVVVLSSSIVDMEKATVKLMSAWFRRLVAGYTYTSSSTSTSTAAAGTCIGRDDRLGRNSSVLMLLFASSGP